MPNIQIVNKLTAGNQQDNWNQSNGYNVFTLYDSALDMPKFILIVSKYTTSGNVEIGRLTKWPNEDGYAHFDIQGLLKGNLGYETDEPELLATAPDSTIQLILSAGYLDESAQGYTITDISPVGLAQDYYLVTNGVKRQDELIWAWGDYAFHMIQEQGVSGLIYGLATTGTFPNAEPILAKPLSDYNEVTTGVGSCLFNEPPVRNFNIGQDEDLTLSFINRAYFDSYVNTNCIGSVGVRTWWFEFLTADGSNRSILAIPNTTANGGGPWVTWSANQGDYINDQYNISRVQVGASNSQLASLWADLYNGTYDYVYVAGSSHNYPQLEVLGFFNPPPQCVIDSGMTDYWDVDQTDIVTEVIKLTPTQAECNDFEHVRVKWKNSFGVDDYFTFTKRHDEVIDINRTTFTKNNPNWAANTFSVDLTNRGKTNITNKFNYTGTLRTYFLSDAEQVYLKNLLMSTEVQAKIDGEWKPIVVTNARWNKRTFRTDRLFQLELQYELASPAITQIG
jgi:hypothetical protein